MASYDVIVIGGGPGGYVAAIRCAQLGLKTACVEGRETLGGTCLNVGCIPSKALLDSSEHFYNAQHNFSAHGIEVKGLKANLAQMIARKNEVVSQTCAGVKYLMDKNKITVFEGKGSFVDANHVAIEKTDGTKETIEKQFRIIESQPYNTTASLQRDILDGKPSELEAQNGAIVRLGKELGIPTPTNSFIYDCLLPLENKARR